MDKLIGKSEIYMITCCVTGKQYIGQTQCLSKSKSGIYIQRGSEKRWDTHLYYSKNDIGKGCPYLIESIKTYGVHNHQIKPLFICLTEQADYYEVKYIRQYNTQVPNGLNLMKGGKKAPLAEETKQKLSQSKKGKYCGELNPMFGKSHSLTTLEKMRQSQLGKILPRAQKDKMSKAHTKNKEVGKLPPRRKHNELPKYIYHVKSYNKEGYEIRHHPKLQQKQFVAKSVSLEENLERAIKYLEDEDNPLHQKQQLSFQEYSNLPRFIRHVRSEKYEGFEVKLHPTLPNKKWTSMKLTMDQKLQMAQNFLEESSETKSLSVN